MGPIFTSSIDPDSIDPALFVNRDKEIVRLKGQIASFIDHNQSVGRTGRFLIMGERGIGKSILSHKILNELKDEVLHLQIRVDGRQAKSTFELLQLIAEKLHQDAKQVFTDKTLVGSAELLYRVSRSTTYKVKEVEELQKEVNYKLGTSRTFLSLIKAEISLGGKHTQNQSLELEYAPKLTEQLLTRMLQAFFDDLMEAQHKVLVFIDNLDQVASGQSEKDVERITQFTTTLMGLERLVLVINLRSEFVPRELARAWRPIRIKGLESEVLLKILDARLERSLEKDVLQASKLDDIAQELSKCIDNPWVFLQWVDYLVNNTEIEPETFGEELNDWVESKYPRPRWGDIQAVIQFFLKHEDGTVLIEEWKNAEFSDSVKRQAKLHHLIIPDFILEPTEFHLNPELLFYKHCIEKR